MDLNTFYSSTMQVTGGLITRHGSRRLWNYLRVARIDYAVCDAGGAAALRYMYGSTYGIFPRDMESLKMVIVWGFNPAVSAVHMWRHILDARHRGGIIVTIDLRRSETAKQSDLFVQIKPG